MDLTLLTEELKKPEYSTLTDAEAAEAVSAKVVTVRKPLPTKRLRKKMIERGLYAKLVDASTDIDLPAPKRQLAITVLALVDTDKSGLSSIDIDREPVSSLLDALVAQGFCTTEEASEVRGSAAQQVSWASHVGLGIVGLGFVRLARKG